MKLENIGFYTLCDERAKNVTEKTPLWRCELILTDKCNFKCPYCRGVKPEYSGSLSFEEAAKVVDIWTNNKLQNIRFSGGEPTLWEGLEELVKKTKAQGVKRIAISSNGSADFDLYDRLISAGVNDFSISLDACCSSTGDKMAGGISGAWKKVTENIKRISKKSYTTVGVVLTQSNRLEASEIIQMASNELGVSDIRIISAAQLGQKNDGLNSISKAVLEKHPILKYRKENMCSGRGVRGLSKEDNNHCPLVLDDMAVMRGYHFPCIIYMREGGKPIGKINDNVRQERLEWFKKTNVHEDPICKNNCLDVCVDYLNKVRDLNPTYGRYK